MDPRPEGQSYSLWKIRGKTGWSQWWWVNRYNWEVMRSLFVEVESWEYLSSCISHAAKTTLCLWSANEALRQEDVRGWVWCFVLKPGIHSTGLKHQVIMIGMLGTRNGHWIMSSLVPLCQLCYPVMLMPGVISKLYDELDARNLHHDLSWKKTHHKITCFFWIHKKWRLIQSCVFFKCSIAFFYLFVCLFILQILFHPQSTLLLFHIPLSPPDTPVSTSMSPSLTPI